MSDSDESDDASSQSGSDSGSEDGSDSGSDSGSQSESGSGSGSDSDNSESDGDESETEEKSAQESTPTEAEMRQQTIWKVQEVSQKLSWLLEDMHRTFEPKGVPKIDPSRVFPRSFQRNVNSHTQTFSDQTLSGVQIVREIEPADQNIPQNIAQPSNPICPVHQMKSPISSPRRRNEQQVDRGAGAKFIYPDYAKPPSQNEINSLYRHYTDSERQQMSQTRRTNLNDNSFTPRKFRGVSNTWLDTNFSDSLRNAARENRSRLSTPRSTNRPVSNFKQLYRDFNAQTNLIKKNRQQNRAVLSRNRRRPKSRAMSNFRRRSESTRIQSAPSRKQTLSDLRETEQHLLSEAANLLLGSNQPIDSAPSVMEDGDQEDLNRLPAFM